MQSAVSTAAVVAGAALIYGAETKCSDSGEYAASTLLRTTDRLIGGAAIAIGLYGLWTAPERTVKLEP